MMRCEVVDSVTAIAATEWNALAWRDGLYSSHEWLTAVERESTTGPRYLAVRREDTLLAALPLYPISAETNQYYLLRAHFADLPPTAGTEFLLGTSGGYRNAPLVAENATPQERSEALHLLLTTARNLIAEAGGSAAGLLFLTAEGVDRVHAAGVMVHTALTYVGDAWLEVRGEGFTDYQESLSHNRKRQVHKEIRRFREAGFTVDLDDPEDNLDLIVSLVDQLNRKYGRVIPDHVQERMLTRQFEVLGAQARLFTCRRNGAVVAVTLGYEWGDWLYLRLIGFDYAKLDNAYEYFNLNIYEPLRYCYARGLRGLHLGAASHQAKGARGARIEPLVSMLLTTDVVDDPVPAAHQEEVARYWEEEMTRLPRAWNVKVWRRMAVLGAPGGERSRRSSVLGHEERGVHGG